MKKFVILCMFFCYSFFMHSQSQLSFSLYQDLRLGIVGDENQEDAGNSIINILARLNMQGKQNKWGYLLVFPEFEFAELDDNYFRASANVGYTFNNLFVKGTEASFYAGGGLIGRWGVSTYSWGGGASAAMKVGKIKLLMLAQFTERSDLRLRYGGNTKIRFSGFVGVEIPILIN